MFRTLKRFSTPGRERKGRKQRCYSSSLTHTYFAAKTSPPQLRHELQIILHDNARGIPLFLRNHKPRVSPESSVQLLVRRVAKFLIASIILGFKSEAKLLSMYRICNFVLFVIEEEPHELHFPCLKRELFFFCTLLIFFFFFLNDIKMLLL